MFGPSTRKALHEACRLFGSIRSIARETGIDSGNLSRWFLGKPTLSEEKVGLFLDFIGLPNLVARRDIVHEWNMQSVTSGNYPLAFALYFPSGAQLARASWTDRGLRHGLDSLRPSFFDKNEVFAMTDGRVRAVVRLPRNLGIQKANMGNVLKWRNGDLKGSALPIEEEDARWMIGPITIADFDEAWGLYSDTIPMDASDVLTAIQDAGISYEEAVRRIRWKS